MIPSFLASEKALSNELAAKGQYLGSNHYKRSGANYVATVQAFLSDSIGYAATMNQSSRIDKSALLNALNSYRTQDQAYAVEYYASVNWGISNSGYSSFIQGLIGSIDSVYDLALHFPF